MNDRLDWIWYPDLWIFWDVLISPEVTFPSVLKVPLFFPLPYLSFFPLFFHLIFFTSRIFSLCLFFSPTHQRETEEGFTVGSSREIIRPVLLEMPRFSTNAKFSVCDILHWSPQFFSPLTDTFPHMKRKCWFWLFSLGGLKAQQCCSDRTRICRLRSWRGYVKGGPFPLIKKKNLYFCLCVN